MLIILDQHEPKYGHRIDKIFSHNDTQLSSTLLLPEGNGPFPLMVFIHGDGPTNRWGNDGYIPVMNQFLKNGVACLSWDKAGVEESSGNWLDQTMRDRAEEVTQAIKSIRSNQYIDSENIGVIGFSQGGWVLSELAGMDADINFMIAVGVAINWQSQSQYLLEKRMSLQGFDQDQIHRVQQYEGDLIDNVLLPQAPYHEYLSAMRQKTPSEGALNEPMSNDRYQFVLHNLNADMENGLSQVDVPFLGIFGQADLNVNVQESVSKISQIFEQSKHQNYQLKVIPNATHSLLNADYYNFQTYQEWSTLAQISYLLEGPDAFADGFLDLLTEWTMSVTQSGD